jgi:hypothetical protein
MVYVDPAQAPVYRCCLQGGPLNGESFTELTVPVEGQRFASYYLYRGKRSKRRNRGDYIFEYAPVPASPQPAPAPQPVPVYEHPTPEPDPPGVFDARMVLAGYINSSSTGPGRGNDVLSACQWLQAQHPAHAAKEARRWEDMRVSQLCDAEHLAHLIDAKERASSRECARLCQNVIDMLVDAGAPRPERRVCDIHGRAVSA